MELTLCPLGGSLSALRPFHTFWPDGWPPCRSLQIQVVSWTVLASFDGKVSDLGHRKQLFLITFWMKTGQFLPNYDLYLQGSDLGP